MKGIDVSVLQGNIDWNKVYADGYRFAMIKATQGRGEGVLTQFLKRFKDEKFYKNIVGASDAGLACGVYHYFTATNVKACDDEVGYFLAIIDRFKDRINLWACVDVESKYIKGLDRDTLYMLVRRFMDKVKAAGYKPMLYTNPDFLKYRFPVGCFHNEEIWMAHWDVAKPYSMPNTRIWQYGTERVAGIKDDVDANVGYFSEAIPAVCRLAALGVIDTPAYWLAHYKDIAYLDELIIKATAKITNKGTPFSDVKLAITRLADCGVINTPEYWNKNAGKVKWLTELICKLGGAM